MDQLLLWYNIVFALPFGLAMLYLMIMSFGVLPVDFDFDFDHDVDLDMDMDLDADADFDADHGVDLGLDHDVDHDLSGLLKALSILGVGKVPLSITVVVLLLSWGLFGWLSNLAIAGLIATSSTYAMISIAAALVGSFSFTAAISRLLVKVLPGAETYATTPAQLVGRVGEVVHMVDERFGEVRLIDDQHSAINVTCVVDHGEDPIPVGQKVLLYDYQPGENSSGQGRFIGQVYTEE